MNSFRTRAVSSHPRRGVGRPTDSSAGRVVGLVSGLGLVASVLLTGGCQQQSRVQVPNRVLDRPLDVTLTCVRLEEDDSLTALGLGDCAQEALPSCAEEGPQLIGYVANSERNEVAVFRRCDTTAAVVDVDTNAPGYQLVPVGQLPSEIESTTLGCRVITANAGSCDLTLLDGLGLAAIALETDNADQVAPSSLVSKLIPLRSDGLPLGARPGALVTAPRDLSTASSTAPEPVAGDGFEDNQCQNDARGSAWVTFPTCQLLAEVDLSTGRLLQSRQFEAMPDGSVEVTDAGTAPDCPVDCPIQFPDGAPQTCAGADDDPADCRPASGLDGFFPNAVELVRPELYDPETDLGADANLDYASLFVGGSGSDMLVELPFAFEGGAPSGTWEDSAMTLPLEDPQGIVKIRAVPPTSMLDGEHQFLYVIGGDGATHVVDRAFEDDALGVECDTQVDPTTTSPPFPSCNPIAADGGGQGLALDRRPFAAGPGIRVSGGAGFTDWAFFRVADAAGSVGAPFEAPGIVGVGTTSFGRIVLSVFNQLQGPTENADINTAVMDLSIPPHSLWPSEDPTTIAVGSTTLPAVEDEEPERALVGDVYSAQELSPTLRRIDLAYSLPPGDGAVSEARIARAESLGNPSNADGLGLFEGDAVYANEAVRAVVRDYQQWAPVRWTLTWEGTIPGTRSATGRVECDTPGWENGTCILADGSTSEGARLVDESASFCDNGVLPGDKLVILGCGTDDDCGLGQRCLREPTAPSSASGICISAQAYEEEFEVLRQVCAPFINDACGTPRREYLVTRAFQDELHIQALDRPLESHLRAVDPETGLAPTEGEDLSVIGMQEVVDRYTCELPNDPATVNQPAEGRGCDSDAECSSLNGDGEFLCAADGFCRGPCPLGSPDCFECDVDADCGHYGEGALCVDQQCQRPCEPGQRECTQALLPGPRCFAELVDYVVRTRESFTVIGDPAPGFISTRVVLDPATGECRENEAASELLTSRLRLGSDQSSVFNDPFVGIPDCPNPDEASPQDPNPCRIVARRSEGESTLFHQMEYEGEPVPAIRFSTPSISLVLDLVDLLALSSNVDVTDANGQVYTTRYPTEFRQFNRARIPRNYATTFAATAGYIPISEPAVVGNTVMVYPISIIPGPTPNTAYVVDAGGRGGPAGVRGQVIRLRPPQIQTGGLVDVEFLVR
ncbi:MAG: hypothetical protein ACRBN8_04145 [Nannocystales bacterium]